MKLGVANIFVGISLTPQIYNYIIYIYTYNITGPINLGDIGCKFLH